VQEYPAQSLHPKPFTSVKDGLSAQAGVGVGGVGAGVATGVGSYVGSGVGDGDGDGVFMSPWGMVAAHLACFPNKFVSLLGVAATTSDSQLAK